MALAEEEVISPLNGARYLFLRHISEPEENSLRLVVSIPTSIPTRTRMPLVQHCGSVPVPHTHQTLQLKMQSSESSGGNLRL